MTPLRQQMIDAMVLRGMAQRTQQAYLSVVAQLAKHDHCSPDRLDAGRPTGRGASAGRRPCHAVPFLPWGCPNWQREMNRYSLNRRIRDPYVRWCGREAP